MFSRVHNRVCVKYPLAHARTATAGVGHVSSFNAPETPCGPTSPNSDVTRNKGIPGQCGYVYDRLNDRELCVCVRA